MYIYVMKLTIKMKYFLFKLLLNYRHSSMKSSWINETVIIIVWKPHFSPSQGKCGITHTYSRTCDTPNIRAFVYSISLFFIFLLNKNSIPYISWSRQALRLPLTTLFWLFERFLFNFCWNSLGYFFVYRFVQMQSEFIVLFKYFILMAMTTDQYFFAGPDADKKASSYPDNKSHSSLL